MLNSLEAINTVGQPMMTKRARQMIWSGAIGLPVVAIALLIFVNRSQLPQEAFGSYYRWVTSSDRSDSEFAPIQFMWEAPPDVKGYWRVRNSERLTLLKGEAFTGEEHLPREKITDFLNERVRRGDIEYVIIFPIRGTKWGELFPVLDECRKSEVRVVFLNEYEI